MRISKTQKEIINGFLLGDGYLQATGKKNARLRLEHSLKQLPYLKWKKSQLPNLFGREIKLIERINPINNRKYQYCRLQSQSSSYLGKLKSKFYNDSQKIVPDDIEKILSSSRTLAVWYMDDGSYYPRDKAVYFFLPVYPKEDVGKIKNAFVKNWQIEPKIYQRKDRRSLQLSFFGEDREKFFQIIKDKIIPSMRYKVPNNPVTTKSENLSSK